jgi:hypothetical protein
VNTPGLESLSTIHVYVKVPELPVTPLKFIVVVLLESAVIPVIFAPDIVALGFESSNTLILRVSSSPALMGFFARLSEVKIALN